MYFGFVEIIEKWVKEQGTAVFWSYALLVGCLGGFGLLFWLYDGYYFGKAMFAGALILWAVGSYPVGRWEKKHHKEQK